MSSAPHLKVSLIEKILSGGQTGADRAALDWAISTNIPHGGWCPKGRLAEDGPIPARYDLKECLPKPTFGAREQNIIDSDGTVIVTMKPVLTGGSKHTAEFAALHEKPLLHLHAGDLEPSTRLVDFLTRHGIKTLNVAGPRASGAPQIGAFVTKVFGAAFVNSIDRSECR